MKYLPAHNNIDQVFTAVHSRRNQLRLRFWLLLPAISFWGLLSAQTTTRIEVKADRTQILIGEPVRLSLMADIPENEPIRFFRIDTLAHFEVLNRGRIDSTNTGEGTILRQEVIVTSFDSGSWAIPPIPFSDSLASDSLPIEVSYTAYNPDQPYHDVKDIIVEKPKEEEKTPWWWYAAGSALVIALIFYLVFGRKKKQPVPVVQVPRDHYAEAMKALKELESASLEGKLWFTRLVDIFRQYAEEQKGIKSLQQTSEDLLQQMKGLGMAETSFQQLAQALRLSDFVKFARYSPTETDRQQAWQAVRDAIEQLEGTTHANMN